MLCAFFETSWCNFVKQLLYQTAFKISIVILLPATTCAAAAEASAAEATEATAAESASTAKAT